jgi:hypothetical protein
MLVMSVLRKELRLVSSTGYLILKGAEVNVELQCLVASGGVDIFQKSNIGWPQQLPTEKVLKSVKIGFLMFHSTKMDQYWSFSARDDPTIRIRKFLDEIGLWRLMRPVKLKRLTRLMRHKRF